MFFLMTVLEFERILNHGYAKILCDLITWSAANI